MSLPLTRFGYGAAIGETSIRSAIDFAANLGLGAVELNLGIPAFFPEEYSASGRAEIADYAVSHGVTLTIHAPEDLTFLSLHSEVVAAAEARMAQVLEFAADIGARRVTMHLGNTVYFTMPDGHREFVLDDYPERFGSLVTGVLRRLTAKACDVARSGQANEAARDAGHSKPRGPALHNRHSGPILCVENDGFFAHRLIQKWLQQALDESRGSLGLTWDLGHSHNSPAQVEFLKRNLFSVKNCHLHDNNGKTDHLVPGKGSVDLPSYLELLAKNDTHFIFEVRPRSAVPECVEWLRNLR